jgi:hypothetical protein
MNCNDFDLIALALARAQVMDAAGRELSLAHARGCVRCATQLASERFLLAGARAVAAEIATEEAPARVETALLAAFREHRKVANSPTVMALSSKTHRWFLRPAAVAASILVLLSALGIYWMYSNSLNDADQGLAELVAPIELPRPGTAVVELGDKNTHLLPGARAMGQGHQRVRRKSNQTELVTEFYPLMDEEELDSSEVTQVVRVELPASALSAAGITVGPDLAGVPVKAEVALGYDGLARAIRFVR